MSISSLHHINIDTAHPDATIAFYEQVLGLENRPQDRPGDPSTGAWLFLGTTPVVHLNFIDNDDRFGQRSAFNHVAFEGSDFAGMCAHLDDLDLSYETKVQPEISLSQVFVSDPNGICVEVNIRS